MFLTHTRAVGFIGVLHLGFMFGELFSWEHPVIMGMVLNSWPHPLSRSTNDIHLLALVVHNAGIYNGIVAAGLFATLRGGAKVLHIQTALLAGGIVAGVFGAFTLAPPTIIQAICGLIALAVVWFR